MHMMSEGKTYVTKLSRVAKLIHDFDYLIGHAFQSNGLPA